MVLVDPQLEKLFGYEREELLGMPIKILIPEWFRERHLQHRDGFFSLPTVRETGNGMELWGLRKGGTEFPVEIRS